MSRRDRPSGVYVIGEMLGLEADGYTPIMSPYVKIGVASNPEVRIRDLQTANPRNLLMLHWKPFANHAAAMAAEARAHSELAEAHRSGEWFEVNSQIAALCVEFVA